MKFEFEKDPKQDLNIIAEAYYMNDDPTDGICLCIKAKDNKWVWLYPDGDVSCQSQGFDENPIKKFYKGDSITITF